MVFKDDNGGFAFSCDDAKMCINASTWSTRLSQIAKMDGGIRIATRNIVDLDYVCGILGKRPHDIYLICHLESQDVAAQLKERLPNIRVAINDKCNVKMALIAPQTVWISSSDFGKSKLDNSTVGLHSVGAHDRIVGEVFDKMWNSSVEIQSASFTPNIGG